LNQLKKTFCCPSLFDEKMEDIPKRKKIRKARRRP